MHAQKQSRILSDFFFPHLLTWVPGLSICWMSSKKPGNRKPLPTHLALWKNGSWLESKHLFFSLTSWIHAFYSLHYTCTFFWEINALHVKTLMYCIVHSLENVCLFGKIPLVSFVFTHVHVQRSWATKETFCMFSPNKEVWGSVPLPASLNSLWSMRHSNSMMACFLMICWSLIHAWVTAGCTAVQRGRVVLTCRVTFPL